MRATRVFGGIATNSRGFLAGGVGGKMQIPRRGEFAQIGIDQAGLDPGGTRDLVDMQYLAHAPRRNHHATSGRHRAARQAGATTAGHDGHTGSSGNTHAGGDFSGGGGHHHNIGAGHIEGAPVVFVHH